MLSAKISVDAAVTGDWFLLDKQNAYSSMPPGRNTCTADIFTAYEKEVYRMTWEASSSEMNAMQLGEIDWWEEGGITETTATAIYSGNDQQNAGQYADEGAQNLGKSDSNKKWYSYGMNVDLIFTFPRNTIMHRTGLYWPPADPDGNEQTGRDPRTWRWYYLEEDLSWYEVARHENQNLSEVRAGAVNSFFGDFSVYRQPRCGCLKSSGFFI